MKKKLEYPALFLLFILLGISRRVPQLLYPDIWDEDGTQIIPGILTKGIHSLFEPVNGYLVLVPKLISFITLHISFYNYPLLSSLFSFLLTALVALAVALSPTRLPAKKWCALTLFLIPSNPEVYGLPLYTFWWVSVLLFLLVLWDEEQSKPLLRVLYLVFGGLSSPVIVMLLPMFYWRSFVFRKKPIEHLVSVLATIFVFVQLEFVLSSGTSGFPPLQSVLIHVLPKFVGGFLIWNIKHKLAWLAGLAMIALMAAWIYESRPFSGRYLVPILLYLLFISIVLSVLRVDPAIIDQKGAGPRYFFYPFIVLYWILVSIKFSSNRKLYRNIASLFLFIAFCNATSVWSRSHDDMHWKDHVWRCRFFHEYTFPIHYDGKRALAWHMPLTEQQFRPEIERDLLDRRSEDSALPSYPFSIIADSGAILSPGIVAEDVILKKPDIGADYAGRTLKGFVVLDTCASSGADTNETVLKLHRGDTLLYRTASEDAGGRLIIDSTGKRFIQELPVSKKWIALKFSNRLLPDTFIARFVDERVLNSLEIAVSVKKK